MEQVNLGSLPDGTGGDSIRVGFQKCNDNFLEVAEKLKTAGGGASAEELKQIKDAATALAERVEKLEKAGGGGGGVPADELAELKQQLQQLQTKLTAAVQAAGEAAGQAEDAAHAAGAAQQTATSAQQAAGSATQTANAAKQEAAAAEQAVAGKADTNHTHTHNQISDWDTALAQTVSQAVANAFPAQKTDNGYLKLPNGLIIQWVRINKTIGAFSGNYNFPLAFPNACFGVLCGNQHNGGGSGYTAAAGVVSNAAFKIGENVLVHVGAGSPAQIFVIAIGY